MLKRIVIVALAIHPIAKIIGVVIKNTTRRRRIFRVLQYRGMNILGYSPRSRISLITLYSARFMGWSDDEILDEFQAMAQRDELPPYITIPDKKEDLPAFYRALESTYYLS